ncbi:hypothetical protein CPT_Seuss108 [Caulobacter phage Seuss]|uniref:Uncharacterized protein n=1 Tax=Caulobacter phage Seuss TaxID=1675601 RepID=A0A0K1LME1_9CAUD|nr:hypothetical protein HOR08_gp108 [Caulobacter phage Seuss]AKU43634.1 hypothetical protein CPT_Seuss108 [Caulobacter phage Seuss]
MSLHAAPVKLPAAVEIRPGTPYHPNHWDTCPTLARQRIYDAIYNEAREAAIAACKDMPDGGACGFAWVVFRPATHPFIRHMKATGRGSAHYAGGWQFWNPGEYRGQSIDAIEAGATAFAKVLQSYWPERNSGARQEPLIYAGSRLD